MSETDKGYPWTGPRHVEYFYLGPYTVCDNKETTVEGAVGRTCPDASCDWGKQDASMMLETGMLFCAGCGAGLLNVLGPVTAYRVSQDAIEGLNQQLLFWGNVYEDIYIPGPLDHAGFRDNNRPLLFTLSECQKQISLDNQSAELVWFIDEFEKELGILRDAYGTKSVGVHWGLVSRGF